MIIVLKCEWFRKFVWMHDIYVVIAFMAKMKFVLNIKIIGKLFKWIDMAIISSLFNSIQFWNKIIELNCPSKKFFVIELTLSIRCMTLNWWRLHRTNKMFGVNTEWVVNSAHIIQIFFLMWSPLVRRNLSNHLLWYIKTEFHLLITNLR